MASIVGICNNALAKLGEDVIISLTENSKAARTCNLLFESIRDALLRSHPWNFAIRRVELAQLTTTPVFEWSYEYQLPTDCLRALMLEEDDIEFKIEGRKLLTDNDTAKLKYIARVEDPNEYDTLFAELLSARLAAEMAPILSDSTTLAQLMWELYQQKLKETRSMDAQEGSPENITANTWVESRV